MLCERENSLVDFFFKLNPETLTKALLLFVNQASVCKMLPETIILTSDYSLKQHVSEVCETTKRFFRLLGFCLALVV